MQFPRILRGAIAASLLALAAIGPAQAGSFSANPVRLSLPPWANSTSLTLENKGDAPVLIQASTVLWQQQAGKDVLTPTEDLVVSPPIFTIPPGGTQTVRVGLMRPADPARELSYRLFLQEVPPPPKDGEPGVAVALKLGLPVFVLPATKAAQKLAWEARTAEDGAIELSLSNDGGNHVQVVDARLQADDGTLVAEMSPRAYVLPGQAQTWRMKPVRPWSGSPLRLSARTPAGEITTRLNAAP